METPKLVIVPPADLPSRLHQQFKSTVSALGPLLFGSASPEAVARLVRLRDEERQMQATVDAEGMQVPGRRPGETVRHKLLGPLAKVRTEIRRLESELALTPAARRRVLGRPKAAEENDAWEGFAMEGLLQSFADPSWKPPAELEARMAALWAGSATAKLHEGRKRRRR